MINLNKNADIESTDFEEDRHKDSDIDRDAAEVM